LQRLRRRKTTPSTFIWYFVGAHGLVLVLWGSAPF